MQSCFYVTYPNAKVKTDYKHKCHSIEYTPTVNPDLGVTHRRLNNVVNT